MTYAEAIAQGYRESDRKLQMGYVSRLVRKDDAIVRTAGGRRKGELYILYNDRVSRYMVRIYLTR